MKACSCDNMCIFSVEVSGRSKSANSIKGAILTYATATRCDLTELNSGFIIKCFL